MEIDVTAFVNGSDAGDYSASRMELGDDAGRITWANAKREAADAPMLTTEAQLDALRQWACDSGGWSRDEIAAWSDEECNALFIQIVAGELRELESVASDDDGEIDWTLARELWEDGRISGCLYPCDVPGHPAFGRLFYSLES